MLGYTKYVLGHVSDMLERAKNMVSTYENIGRSVWGRLC